MNFSYLKFLLSGLCLFAFSLYAYAYDVESNGIYYNYINQNTELEVTKSPTLYSGDIVIPADVTINETKYNVTSIGSGAFQNSSELLSVVIGDNVKTICEDAFNYCDNLKTAIIPNTVTEIKDRAFRDCKKLEHVDLPTGLTYIGDRCFESNKVLDNVVIPDNVKTIRAFAFHQCSGMKKLTIGEGVETIGNSAFEQNNSLENLYLPQSVKTIGQYAFKVCNSLKSIEIPNQVTRIEYSTFMNCSSVESITIPESVTYIYLWSFRGCDKLTSVTCLATTPPALHGDAFSTYCPLYVNEGCKTAYQTDDVWNKFSPINEVPTLPTDPDKEIENEYVDLGLPSGKLWATCNIGAKAVEEFGTYFDWIDNPVQENWNEVWRTPTKEERDELLANCTYSLDTVNEVKGARYTGKNGNSIFFPFAGYYQWSYGPYKVGIGGQYWTVTPYIEETHWVFATNYEQNTDDNAYYWPNPYFSFPVRAIRNKIDDVNPPTGIIGIKNNDISETIYKIDGTISHTLQHGISIVRHPDGTIHKVIQK